MPPTHYGEVSGTTLVHLASSASVDDRLGASHALSAAQASEVWRHRDIVAAFDRLTHDRSFRIRKACGLYRNRDEQGHERAS
jgi:hypothetical protein